MRSVMITEHDDGGPQDRPYWTITGDYEGDFPTSSEALHAVRRLDQRAGGTTEILWAPKSTLGMTMVEIYRYLTVRHRARRKS